MSKHDTRPKLQFFLAMLSVMRGSRERFLVNHMCMYPRCRRMLVITYASACRSSDPPVEAGADIISRLGPRNSFRPRAAVMCGGGGGGSGEGGGGEGSGVGAAHFLVVCVNGTVGLHKSVCGPLRKNMWEYGLIACCLVRDGHLGAFFCFVLIQLFIPRYMRPEGPCVRGQSRTQAIRGWPGVRDWPGNSGPSADGLAFPTKTKTF